MKQFFKFSVSNIQIKFSKGDSVLSTVFCYGNSSKLKERFYKQSIWTAGPLILQRRNINSSVGKISKILNLCTQIVKSNHF